MHNQPKKVVIIASLLVIGGILIYLGFRYFAPFGKVVSYRFSQKIPGAENVAQVGDKQNDSIKIVAQLIKSPTSRFSLKVDRNNLEKINVYLKFKPGQKAINLGLRGNENESFTYQPLYFSPLKDIGWDKIEENGLTLWQRIRKYNSLSEFVSTPQDNKKVGLYKVSQNKLLSLKSIEAKPNTSTTINTSLRGNHSFLIYVNQSPLVIKVSKQDMNNYAGADRLKISLLDDKTAVQEKVIEDDGIADNSRLTSFPQEGEIRINDIKIGIYSLDLTFDSKGDDSSIVNLEINQSKVMFKNKIFLIGGKAPIFWTNAENITLSSWHEEGLQDIKLNGLNNLSIGKVGIKYPFNLKALSSPVGKYNLYKLEPSRSDLIIESPGYFSTSEDSYFQAEVIKSVDLSDFNDDFIFHNDIDYILTQLNPLKKEGEWLVADVSIDPKEINITGNTLFFSLEVPDLSKFGGSLEIESLEVTVKNKGALESKAAQINTQASPSPVKKGILPTVSLPKIEFLSKIVGIKDIFLNQTGKVFSGITGKISSLLPKGSPSSPGKSADLTPTQQSNKPTPTVTIAPTLAPANKTLKVSVLNGSNEAGVASKFVEVLKNAGFMNALSGNADRNNYKNATLRHRKEDKDTAAVIADMLKKEYLSIDQIEIATTSATLTVILGAK